MSKLTSPNAQKPSTACTQEIDAALAADSARLTRSVARSEPLTSLAGLLRLAGAIILISAALSFMLKQWPGASYVVRYFYFLGFTTVLSFAGFLTGLRIRDDKGARTFLAVTAAIVPVHFSILGALLFSRFGDPLAAYPEVLTWIANTDGQALVTVACSLLALIPITFLSFSTLARARAIPLTITYIAANSVLLVPIRHPDIIGLMAFGLLSTLVMFDIKVLQKERCLRTLEGIFARLLMAIPFAILVGRNIHIYDSSRIFGSMLFASTAIVLFIFLPEMLPTKSQRELSQSWSTLPMAAAWYLLALEILAHFEKQDSLVMVIVFLPIASILVIMSLFTTSDGENYRTSAALLAATIVILQVIKFGGPENSLLCIVLALITGTYGYVVRNRLIVGAGSLAFLFGIASQLASTVSLYPWIALAAVGIGTIVAASYIERSYPILRQKLKEFQTGAGRWS